MFILYVSGAVRHNKRLTGETTNEIKTVVKLWLRYARDGSGGRPGHRELTKQTVATATSATWHCH